MKEENPKKWGALLAEDLTQVWVPFFFVSKAYICDADVPLGLSLFWPCQRPTFLFFHIVESFLGFVFWQPKGNKPHLESFMTKPQNTVDVIAVKTR